MNCKLATLFFFIFIVKSYSQNDLTVTQIPNWVNFQNVPENDNYDSGDIKYLLLDEQINIDKEVSYNHISIRVNTQNGIQTIFPYKLEYDPSYQKLKFHTLTIIRAKEKINKLQKKSITILNREHNAEKHLLTKSLTALINLDDIIIGDIIDLEYSIEGFNPIFKGHFSNSFPISAQIYLQKVHINVLCNPNKKIYYKFIGLNKKEPFITNKNNLKSYEWSFKTINPIPNEEGVPFWYLQSSYLDVSDYNSWSDVVKWGLNLFPTKKYNTKKYNALYDSLKTNSIGKYSYVINSLRYVQDEIRYLSVSNGVNSYKPHSPDVVLENRYGDCKDKVYLLLSLLEKEKIEAYPVLVNSELRHSVSKFLPSASIFNHCVIKVILDKKSYWFDPTITFQRGKFGFTYMPNYSIGLILKSNSTNLEQIEQSTYTRLETDYYYEIPNLIDSTRLFIETRYYGYEADYIRNFLNNTSKQNIDKYFLETISNIHPDVKITIPTRHSDDVIKNVIIIYENYLIGNFWSQSNKSDTNQFSSIFKAKKISDALYLPQSKIRTLPLMIYSYPTVYKENIHISLPFKINIDTSTFTDITKYFSFSMQAKQPDNTNISLIYNYSTLASFVEINDFKKHVISVNNLSNYLLYNVFFTKNSDNNNLNEGRIAAWILLFFTITFFILFILASVYVNKKYNPTSIYFDQIAEPIPFKMYLILVFIVIITLIKIISIIVIIMQSDILYQNLLSKESQIFNPIGYFIIHTGYLFDIFFIVFGGLCIYQFYNKRFSTLFNFKVYYIILTTLTIFILISCGFTGIIEFSNMIKTIFSCLLFLIPILIYIYTFNNYESVFINSYKAKKAIQEDF